MRKVLISALAMTMAFSVVPFSNVQEIKAEMNDVSTVIDREFLAQALARAIAESVVKQSVASTEEKEALTESYIYKTIVELMAKKYAATITATQAATLDDLTIDLY